MTLASAGPVLKFAAFLAACSSCDLLRSTGNASGASQAMIGARICDTAGIALTPMPIYGRRT